MGVVINSCDEIIVDLNEIGFEYLFINFDIFIFNFILYVE